MSEVRDVPVYELPDQVDRAGQRKVVSMNRAQRRSAARQPAQETKSKSQPKVNVTYSPGAVPVDADALVIINEELAGATSFRHLIAYLKRKKITRLDPEAMALLDEGISNSPDLVAMLSYQARITSGQKRFKTFNVETLAAAIKDDKIVVLALQLHVGQTEQEEGGD